MPKVGTKTFPYTSKGKSAAKKAAKKAGKKLTVYTRPPKKVTKK